MGQVEEMEEPKVCDYGHRFHGYRCEACSFEYDQGASDADNYHAALLIGGEELAAQLDLEAEFGYMG